jgi:SAM-dependent methyltransferase
MSFLEEYQERAGQWSDVQYCMPRMLETALRYPEVTVLELGVRSGNSTSAFLAAAEKNGGHVWSADTEPPGVPASWAGSGLWTFIQGDDLTLDLPVTAFDVVFVDTSHHYAQTLTELRRFVPVVKPGGTVLLHDTLLAHVDGENLPFPVTLAVATFCSETGRGWTEYGGPTGFAEITRPNG